MMLGVESIATSAREEFEHGSIDKALLARLYASYSNVGNTEKFIEAALKLFPTGNCGVASLYLQHQIGGEIRRLTYAGHSHSVLCTGPNEIVDITADQFGGPRIYVGPIKKPWLT